MHSMLPEALGPPEQQDLNTEFVLDRLARWHVDWEKPERQAVLETCPWLVQQDSRLWWGADDFAAAVGLEPRHPERVLDNPDPAANEFRRRCVRVFWDGLTDAQRRVWS